MGCFNPELLQCFSTLMNALSVPGHFSKDIETEILINMPTTLKALIEKSIKEWQKRGRRKRDGDTLCKQSADTSVLTPRLRSLSYGGGKIYLGLPFDAKPGIK